MRVQSSCLTVLFAVGLGTTLVSCIRTNSVTLGRKTDLERQLIGKLEPLSEEQLLAASVRAEPSAHRGSIRELEDRAIAARRRQLFNRDDLRSLEAAGCVGETAEGRVRDRPCSEHPQLEIRDRLIAEENLDRNAIIDWAIEADPRLTPGDEAQVRKLYHRMVVELAPEGTPCEAESGEWRPKE